MGAGLGGWPWNIRCYELALSGPAPCPSAAPGTSPCSNQRLSDGSARDWNVTRFQPAASRAGAGRSFAGRNIRMFQMRPGDVVLRQSEHRDVPAAYSRAMRTVDIQALFDFTYWADRQILEAAAAIPVGDFVRPVTITYRNLRGTLVHTLDVEMSWRRRLRGEPKEIWDASLSAETYPTVDALADQWARDEAEMRAWLASLSDDDLTASVDLDNDDRFPLWYYLVHIVTHSEQQRRDVQIILTHLGHEPPELEFLYYADSLVEAD